MADTTEPQAPVEKLRPRSAGSRIAWFIGLYGAGLLAVAVVAWFWRTLLGML
ncbi:MAG TPA: hypothetical protein VLA31_10060 [Burkholderiaceae bacterium]|nr:hypothetical protein [Burkholderiaceae bacterium]